MSDVAYDGSCEVIYSSFAVQRDKWVLLMGDRTSRSAYGDPSVLLRQLPRLV